MAERNRGSSIVAWDIGFVLFGVAAWTIFQIGPEWSATRKFVDAGSCLLFAVILFVWALSGIGEHKPNPVLVPGGWLARWTWFKKSNWWRIGNESVVMVVAVLTAVVAILTLTDAASRPRITAALPENPVDAILRIQQRLMSLGYQPGAVDGCIGVRTAAAIRKFQKDQGVKVTGTADEKTLALLK